MLPHCRLLLFFFFFFNDTATTEIYTLSLHDALPIYTGGEASIAAGGPNFIGNIWLGSKGYMSLDHQSFQIYLGDKREPGEGMKGSGRGDTKDHMSNFLEAVKSRNYKDLHGEVQEGATSAVLVHMANTSYQLGRKLAFDASAEKYVN